MQYIDSVAGHRDEGGLRWGVESICEQLTELGAKIAPATYYEHRARKAMAREVSDAELKPMEPDPKTVASTGFAVMTPSEHIGSSLLTSVAASAEFADHFGSVAHGSA